VVDGALRKVTSDLEWICWSMTGGHAQVDNLLQPYQQSGEANNSGIVIPR
jgi:hypothetical protein